MRANLILFSLLFVLGCGPGNNRTRYTAPTDIGAVMILDNQGGYFGGGRRRVVLQVDGFYSDFRYSYAGAGERTNREVYVFSADKTKLSLSPEGGERTHLYRVNHDDINFWVVPSEIDRVTRPEEDTLRRASLKTKIR